MGNKQNNRLPFSGKVIYVGSPETYTSKAGNTKTTRTLVLEAFKGNYRQEVAFDFREMNLTLLNGIKEGEWVDLEFCLGGNRAKDGKARWYNNLEGLTVIKG